MAAAFVGLRDNSTLLLRLAEYVSHFNRSRKLRLLMSEASPTAERTIMDVGVKAGDARKAENFLEKYYPYPSRIIAVGIEDLSDFVLEFPVLSAVQYGGRWFPFRDKSIDICWSNAVIEHVGNRDDQVQFLKEIHRVSRRAFVTTPNRYFPIEVHTLLPFIQFLPDRAFAFVLRKIRSFWVVGENLSLLGMKDIRGLLASAGICEYKIIKNRFLGFTLDFVIVFA